MRIKGFIVPLVLFILWNCLDIIDEENGCPQSGAALISVVLLVIPLGWYVRTSTSTLHLCHQFKNDRKSGFVAYIPSTTLFKQACLPSTVFERVSTNDEAV